MQAAQSILTRSTPSAPDETRRDEAIGAFRVPAISRPLKTETASSGPSRAESPAGLMDGGCRARLASFQGLSLIGRLDDGPRKPGSHQTPRWRKTDSNSRSLREGKGYGQPLQASIAVSDLSL